MTWFRAVLVTAMLSTGLARASQQAGTIRGRVFDKDFDLPLAAAEVRAVETGQRALTDGEGSFVIAGVAPGRYTLVFSKEGYARQVVAEVAVVEGQLTDLTVALPGEFTELDEFVVQDVLQLGAGSEASLLQLRLESAALVDSIGSDLLSRAGASDAAAGLRLVSGASLQDGKFAVIRGLPDRYVSSQINGVRLPTADEDKRAVELDQFPSSVIESIQVTKTFTPDQQGDASGGAVDVKLKSIPDEAIFSIRGQLGYDTNVTGRTDFLTYDDGGVSTWGHDHRDIQVGNLGGNWDGGYDPDEDDAPPEYKFQFAAGGKIDLGDGVKIGGLATFFYERDSSFYDDAKDDSYWVETPGGPLVPQTFDGASSQDSFKTKLFDIQQSEQSVRWGGLGTFGIESEHHAVGLTYLYTRVAEDTVTVATDTRGKEYFFPDYDVNDPKGTGNEPVNRFKAPYLRYDTLAYSERTTETFQINGWHQLEIDTVEVGDFTFKMPEFDWTIADSTATLYEPDKRLFRSYWVPRSFIPGFGYAPPTWFALFPAENANLGNAQRIWERIDETGFEYSANLKLPFDQWDDHEGYFKFGWFDDSVDRNFDQDTFSNFADPNNSFESGWDDPWSEHFDEQDHPITESQVDVDYVGEQDIAAYYGMVDLPLTSQVDLIGGVRFESTDISIVNSPERDALWIEPGQTQSTTLDPGEGNADFSQDDVLPSIGLVYEPHETVTLRASYAETVARQTFKELSPILQQEYLGGPIFIGNPDLEMSALDNYDLRVDYRPQEGSLMSASWFKKDVGKPIEYVQRDVDFSYTTPVNYPEGELDGWELEVRQDLGALWDWGRGLSVGANATLIDSEVQLPTDEIEDFQDIGVELSSRDMTNAPEHLYNLFLTYDIERTDTQVALFYTVQGDTLVAGAGLDTQLFIPSVYASEYGTLNFSLFQRLGKYTRLQFQAKNLTNPEIEEVYRYQGDDVTKTSYTKGIEYTVAIVISFGF